MGMKKKSFNVELKDINVAEKTITAVVSTKAIDRMGESLEPSGVDLKNFRKNPIVAWAHDYAMLPIGKALWVKKSDKGIISKVKFADHEFANEVFNLYKEGFLHAFSVGFIPKDWENGDGKKTPFRTYTKWEMLEYSAVPIPANPEALTLAVQKGVVHDDRIIDDIQKAIDTEEGDEEQEDKPEEEHEESEEEAGEEQEEESKDEEKPESDEKGLEDLIAENKLLMEENNGLKNENASLRYDLLVMLDKQTSQLSEIADGLTTDKVRSMIDGAIRKATGKVD